MPVGGGNGGASIKESQPATGGSPKESRFLLHGTAELGSIADLKEKVKTRLENPPARLGGNEIEQLNRLDGLKMIFGDQTWILLRLSGTEPVARCYVEAHNQQDLDRLIGVAGNLFFREDVLTICSQLP